MRSLPGSPEPPRAVDVWLQHEHLDHYERTARLTADRQLLEALHDANFKGPDWDFVEGVLAQYGLAVINGWLRRGLIAAKCAEKRVRCPVIPLWVRDDSQAVEDIASETVAVAIVRFRDEVLAKGIWDPARGASLTTFFINQCLFRFANAFRTWEKGAIDRAVEVTTDDASFLDGDTLTYVEDDVIRSLTAEQVLRGATNERAARALAMDSTGFTNAEIAVDLGVTVQAVKSILKRERAKISQDGNERGVS